jgi:replication-associated recombination protein RarA
MFAENKRTKRKMNNLESLENPHVPRKRIKPKIKYEELPEISSLSSLIKIGKSLKFYKNIDTIMLWKITPYLEELDNLVGMTSLKQTIFYQVIYYLQGMHLKNQNEEYLHTVIYGSPGYGKTTVAIIIGKLYKAMNILGEGDFKIAHRDDFVAGYLGQTAIKTKKLLTSCIGGCCFIDEVYSLGNHNDRDSFSKEAIDTLNAFLSEHKNDFCCIIAGYEDEVNSCFFSVNKGLERRFPWVHKIDTYTKEELYSIFEKMLGNINWSMNFSKSFLIDIFEKEKNLFKYAGGDIETFLTKVKMIHSKNTINKKPEHKFILTEKDIKDTIDYLKKNSKNIENKIPDGLYT